MATSKESPIKGNKYSILGTAEKQQESLGKAEAGPGSTKHWVWEDGSLSPLRVRPQDTQIPSGPRGGKRDRVGL